MNESWYLRPFALVVILLLMTAALPALDVIVKAPSDNAGKTGIYQVMTEFPGNNYYVSVPSTYSDTNPAGLHIYFHGQNGQNGASKFGTFQNLFLEKYNLIGINMQYMDGDNQKELGTKVLAARHALAQVIADYKIIVGRGVICCFSGGGLPSGVLYNESSAQRDASWPFNHMALYSSNSRMGIRQTQPISWAISVGEKEWQLAALGSTQGARYADVSSQFDRHADIFFTIIKDGKHTVHKQAVIKSSEIFGRQDIASSPLLYTGDYPEKDLAKLLFACNALAFGPAVKEIIKLRKKKKIDPAILDKVAKIEAAMRARYDQMLGMLKELATTSPALCMYYASYVTRTAKGYDKELEKELKDFLKGIDKKLLKQSLTGQAFIQQQYGSFFISDAKPALSQKISPQIEQLIETLGDADQVTQQLREFIPYK